MCTGMEIPGQAHPISHQSASATQNITVSRKKSDHQEIKVYAEGKENFSMAICSETPVCRFAMENIPVDACT